MTIAISILLVVLVLLALVMRHVRRYGGIKSAFDTSLKADRKELAMARSNVKSLHKDRQQELTAAQSEVEKMATVVASYENPGSGRRLAVVGPVSLFEHLVTIGKEEVPLLGAAVRSETGTASSHLYITTPSGFTHQQAFSTEWVGTGKFTGSTKSLNNGYELVTASEKTRREHSDEQIRSLATAIHNQCTLEARFVADLPALLEVSRRSMVTLEESLATVTAGSAIAAQLAGAQEELRVIEASWALKATTSAIEPA